MGEGGRMWEVKVCGVCVGGGVLGEEEVEGEEQERGKEEQERREGAGEVAGKGRGRN